MAESKEELQSLFLKVKEEGENVALKLDIQKTKIRHLFSSLHGKYVGNNENSERLVFGAPKSLQMVTAAMKLKTLVPWKKSCDKPRQHTKKQKHYFANKSLSNQSWCFQ